MSPIIVWLIIFAFLMGLAYYVTRLIGKERFEGTRHDTGLSILEFGRAFPNEAIRSLHVTADGEAIFLRLHDNKAGFMRSRRNHYSCHLIEPGRVRVQPLPNAKGFTVEFLDAPTQSGSFVFTTEKEAAEVSLWLLNNYVAKLERDAEKSPDANAGASEDLTPDQAR